MSIIESLLRLAGIVILAALGIFCLKRAYFCLLNLIWLWRYHKDPDCLSRRSTGIVFNKKTGKLENWKRTIHPYYHTSKSKN